MNRGKQKAFTIVETVLVVAISGMMVFGVINWFSGRQNRVEFTDAMRSLLSFVESQYNVVQSGVNDDPATPDPATCPKDSDCTFMGRIITASEDSSLINYYSLIGKRLSAGQPDRLAAATPFLEDSANPREYNTVWGVEFYAGSHRQVDGSYTDSNIFGFVRTPRSPLVKGISYNQSDTPATLVDNSDSYSTDPPQAIVGTVDAYYCFRLNGMRAAITLEGSNAGLVFEENTDFNELSECL